MAQYQSITDFLLANGYFLDEEVGCGYFCNVIGDNQVNLSFNFIAEMSNKHTVEEFAEIAKEKGWVTETKPEVVPKEEESKKKTDGRNFTAGKGDGGELHLKTQSELNKKEEAITSSRALLFREYDESGIPVISVKVVATDGSELTRAVPIEQIDGDPYTFSFTWCWGTD